MGIARVLSGPNNYNVYETGIVGDVHTRKGFPFPLAIVYPFEAISDEISN